jgi:hypothetical protein
MIKCEFYKVYCIEGLRAKSTGLAHWNANAVPWQLASRDSFPAKVAGLKVGCAVLPTLSTYTSEPLWVMLSYTETKL